MRGCLNTCALIVAGAVLRGYVLSILWGWFIQPLGVPSISIPWAMGISGIVALLTYQAQKQNDLPPLEERIAALFLVPVVGVVLGAVYRLFM